MVMTASPPPVPLAMRRRPALSPVAVSALVYPGAGQLMQRRWWAASLFGVTFTASAGWLVVRVLRVLTAYYEFAFDFASAAGTTVSPRQLAVPFGLGMAVYLLNVLDAAFAQRRA